jgi:hypothetical protein
LIKVYNVFLHFSQDFINLKEVCILSGKRAFDKKIKEVVALGRKIKIFLLSFDIIFLHYLRNNYSLIISLSYFLKLWTLKKL